MTNGELLEKKSLDMNMRNFSHYTYDFYIRKTKWLDSNQHTLSRPNLILVGRTKVIKYF